MTSFRRALVPLAGTALAASVLTACSSKGAASESGAGGSAADGGATSSSSFVPPAAPQVQFLGGTVLKTPKVQPIAYSADTGLADIEAFLQELTTTTYWSDTTSEYGVGELTILPTIKQTGTPPASPTDADLVASLAMNTTGEDPPWGAVDSDTIYLFVMPQGSNVQAFGAACSSFDGYHEETIVSGMPVAYAVSSACPGFDGPGITLLQERTVNISHELIEAATDPFPGTSPGYTQEDRNDFIWTVATSGELADMCEYNLDAYIVPAGGTYTVQRSWSNARAAATMNPCVPRAEDAVYFNSFPALDAVMWTYPKHPAIATRGLVIPVGESRTIDVNLFSTAPTSGPWKVIPYDLDAIVNGAAPNLSLTLDKDTGESGDTLHLTIKSLSEDTGIGGAGFLLFSDLGEPGDAGFAETLTMGVVVP